MNNPALSLWYIITGLLHGFLPKTARSPDLFEQFRAGDESAFNTLFNDNEAKLIFYINRRVRNLDTARDIALECFSGLWENRNKIQNMNHLGGFLFTLARNASYDYCKKEAACRTDEIDDEMTGSHADTLCERDIIEFTMIKVEIIKKFYDGMPAGQHKNIIGLALEGKNGAGIAADLGIAIQTVRNVKSLIVKKIRKETNIILGRNY